MVRSPAEMKSFLDILPPEIRSEIFKLVFTSPYGVIYLVPTTSDPPMRYNILALEPPDGTNFKMSLSLLRTSKRMYNECKDLIWKYNTLGDDDGYPFSIFPNEIKTKVHSVQINWDFLDSRKYRNCLPLKVDFLELRTWPNLKRLTIQATCPTVRDEEALQRFHELSIFEHLQPNFIGDPDEFIFPEQLEILRAAGGRRSKNGSGYTDGYLSHLERKIVFDSGFPTFNEDGWPERSFDGYIGDPNYLVLKTIALAFGGSLMVDDIVAFKDRESINDIWVGTEAKGPENYPAEWHYSTDMSAWKLAGIYVTAVGGCDFAKVANALAVCPDVLNAPFNVSVPMSANDRVELIKKWIDEGKLPSLT
jgi:hypothetical protein